MTAKPINFAALALAACVASPALAENCALVSVLPASPSIPTWNPITPALQEATFVATIVRKNKGSTNSARLIFVDANSTSPTTRVGTTAGPKYQIINTDTGATASFPSGSLVTGQTIATTALPNGSGGNSVAVNFKVRILANNTPVEDFIGGTNFSETLNYAIQCFSGSTNDGIDNATASNLSVSLNIPKLVSIVTATPATINFGNFTTTTQSAQVTVKSTSSLNVSVSTTNGSQLVRSGAVSPYPTNSTIPYQLTFNNVALTPAAPLSNQTRAGVIGSSFPVALNLTGGLPSGKLAGSYSDTVVLTITPGT